MKKKILYVITKSSWGGAQQYVYDLALQLPRDRFDVAVAAGGKGLLFEKLAGAGIRAIRLSGLQRDINPGKELASFWRLLRVFVKQKPDIVHLNSTKAGALGAPAAKIASFLVRKKIHVVFTVHGWGFREDRSLLIRAAILSASFFSSFFQDAVILINTADSEAARKFIPHKKLHLIFNGLADVDFLPRPQGRAFLTAARGRAALPETIFIGAIAELTKNKGLDYLIDAIALLAPSPTAPSIHLFLIGEGEERAALEAKIKDLGLEKMVTLMGFLTDARRAITGLDIFVLPSRKEGLPYAVMEAMAAGLALVATRVGGLPDLIANGENGLLVPPKDAAALSKALQALSADPVMRRRLGTEAQETVRTKFGFRAMIERTTALYNSL